VAGLTFQADLSANGQAVNPGPRGMGGRSRAAGGRGDGRRGAAGDNGVETCCNAGSFRTLQAVVPTVRHDPVQRR
jgi:hypothetical protein